MLPLNNGTGRIGLGALGNRLCILGPSNSGKSTLAAAIGAARGLAVIHLDQFFHMPGTDWQPRPAEDFIALHDAAIAGENWVIDGNYTRCLPQRLARATGLILLEISTTASLMRYLRRTTFERNRIGGLEGGKDSVKWEMIRYIAITSPKNLKSYRDLYAKLELPKLWLTGAREVAHFYQAEGLQRWF